MAWAITYNDFGSDPASPDGENVWSNVNVTEYSATAVKAEDNNGHATTRHRMVGSALLHNATIADFNKLLTNARARLSRPAEILVIKIGGETIFDNTMAGGGDEVLGTPTVEASFNAFYGEQTAMVTFVITWHKLELLTGDDQTYVVMSHQWTQRFAIDEGMQTTWTVDGNLRVKANADDEEPDDPLTTKMGPNVDRYRGLVVPDLPAGYRVTKQDFATDESAQNLIYVIEAKDYARNLPHPAKKGTGRYQWNRSIGTGGAGGAMGTKTFEGELEGPLGSSPVDMLAELLKVAANRITFGTLGDTTTIRGSKADIVQSIQVSEDDVFNKVKIGIRIVALSVGAVNPNEYRNNNLSIIDDITAGTLDYVPPDVHGATLIRSVRRALFIATDTYTGRDDFPRAETEASPVGPVGMYQRPTLTPGGPDVAPNTAGIETGYVTDQHRDFPYSKIRVTERVIVRTHVVPLESQSITGNALMYQTRKPTVIIESEVIVQRHNAAPPDVTLRRPPGSIDLETHWDVNPGEIDANDNRTFVGRFFRRSQVMDQSAANGNASYWTTAAFTVPGFATFNLRTFVSPSGAMSIPYDPRTQVSTDLDRTIFERTTDPDREVTFNYELDLRPYWQGAYA